MTKKIVDAIVGTISVLVFASMASGGVFFMGEVWDGTLQGLAHCSLLFVSVCVGACAMYSNICEMIDR